MCTQTHYGVRKANSHTRANQEQKEASATQGETLIVS